MLNNMDVEVGRKVSRIIYVIYYIFYTHFTEILRIEPSLPSCNRKCNVIGHKLKETGQRLTAHANISALC